MNDEIRTMIQDFVRKLNGVELGVFHEAVKRETRNRLNLAQAKHNLEQAKEQYEEIRRLTISGEEDERN